MSRILFCEDNPGIRKALAAGLRGSGHDLLLAEDACTGLEIAGRHRPDLVVTDISMPGMDGFDLVDELRARPETADVPVLILSASTMPDVLARAEAMDRSEYIAKPYSTRELIERIEALLDRCRA